MEGRQMNFYPSSSYLVCDSVGISVSLWLSVIFSLHIVSVLICISMFFVSFNDHPQYGIPVIKMYILFKVPEVQKKTVTEEKIHVAVSKKIEPPAKGISDSF